MKLGIKANRLPVVEWLITILSTIEPTHKMFRRDFEKDKKVPKPSKNNPVYIIDTSIHLGVPGNKSKKKCPKSKIKMMYGHLMQ